MCKKINKNNSYNRKKTETITSKMVHFYKDDSAS